MITFSAYEQSCDGENYTWGAVHLEHHLSCWLLLRVGSVQEHEYFEGRDDVLFIFVIIIFSSPYVPLT